jgi:hypothetical protein
MKLQSAAIALLWLMAMPSARKAKDIGQDRRRLLRAVEQQGHALEAADRMFGRDVAVAPARLILCIGDADERERHPVLRERQDGFAKTLLRRLKCDRHLSAPGVGRPSSLCPASEQPDNRASPNVKEAIRCRKELG